MADEVDRHRAGAAELGADAAGAQHLLDGAQQPVGVLEHDLVELLPLRHRRSARLCRVWRYSRIDATGVFSSWVTALMNASCCSLRRISRTRKMVLSTTPVMMSGKARRPRISIPACPPVDDDPADVERQRAAR